MAQRKAKREAAARTDYSKGNRQRADEQTPAPLFIIAVAGDFFKTKGIIFYE